MGVQQGQVRSPEFAPLEWRQIKANTTGGSIHIQHLQQYSTTTMATMNAPEPSPSQRVTAPDCLSCRVIGTGALGATGLYALNQARAHQPGSRVGKRIMAGVGVLFLLGSVARWRA